MTKKFYRKCFQHLKKSQTHNSTFLKISVCKCVNQISLHQMIHFNITILLVITY